MRRPLLLVGHADNDPATDKAFTPHYSTEAGAAFSMLDIFCAKHPKSPSFILARNHKTGRYIAEFVWGTQVLGGGEGKTAAEAICRAVISTKDNDNELHA